MVITRYLYKPTAAEGSTRFNDNRRMHIFVVDIATKSVHQLTSGNFYEHSVDWSPDGREILFVSNHEADSDRVFNYDIFAADQASGAIRRLTDTKNAEYRPSWSPSGKTNREASPPVSISTKVCSNTDKRDYKVANFSNFV